MRIVTSLDDLDEVLAECERAAQLSDDELRRVFQTFRMDVSAQLPSDPFTAEYASAQMALYERIAGRRYSTGNEESIFDPGAAVVRPFPYIASCQVAGAHWGAIAFLLRSMQLRPGARVLDAGAGWGNTTLALAQLGFEVTALDIEPRFCELIRERTRRAGVQVEVINDDFFWIERVSCRFDAIVFFESFHHCGDHLRLLRSLGSALARTGHVYFGAEPIAPDFPLPWGLRTDGESLWQIRRNGWLELGFHPDYFRQALRQAGFIAEVHTSADLPWINVWDAKIGVFEATQVARFHGALTTQPDPPEEDVIAARNTRSRLAGGGVLSLANRVLTKSLSCTMPRVMRHPRLMMLARGLLKPFPGAAARIYRLATTPDSAVASPVESPAATPARGNSGADSPKAQTNVDESAFIVNIYHRLLGRGPDELGMRTFSNMLRNGSLDRVGLINTILSSPEFNSRLARAPRDQSKESRGSLRLEAEAVFGRFQKHQGPGRPGFVTNFLGGLTDVRFVDGIGSLSGIVEGYPIPGNFHGDTLEWVGTLRSALDARNSFTMVELGAGWAPWCVIGYIAAKQLGIEKIKVIGVEGDAGHIDFIRETFAANGIGPDVGEAIHGVVGLTDGDAFFPKASDASRVYGGTAAFSEADKTVGAFADFSASQSALVEAVEQLPCFSLATLMREFDQVDLIHCDIQGGEANLFANIIDLVSAKVKRIVVGTHSFEIDRQLACLFPKNGWDLEGFDGCRMREDGRRPVVVHDGVQVWRNMRF